ncbi:MAG: methylated-DNA--[protein]-cysteine S-methyltransferase [Bryobacteraceae bacterium]|jgi:methylated-DNA-[protein]-cysteine S-methyltransferase
MPVWTSAAFAYDIALFLASDGEALVRASFASSPEAPPPDWPREWAREPSNSVLAAAVQQLGEYFAREREAFSIPLRPAGTPFQLRVWKALEEIPYGHTRTYLDIARALGQPAAVRAVGAANGRNPLPIFVPCHRVIGTNDSLTGYGGGLEVKLALLQLEGVLLPG